MDLRYDSETGLFWWTTPAQHRDLRVSAGSSKKDTGYVAIQTNGRRYQAHNLAWYLTYGVWPRKTLDHIDGDTTNNKLNNLREAGPKLQQLNVAVHKDKESRWPRGLDRRYKKFRVRVTVGKTRKEKD